MTDEIVDRTQSGRDIALVAGAGNNSRMLDLDKRVASLESEIGAVARSLDAMRHVQTVFLAMNLVLLAGFIAAAVAFGLDVSGGMRALNSRLDMDIQARASDQAAADSRLDRFMENSADTSRQGAGQMTPSYALPPLRSRP